MSIKKLLQLIQPKKYEQMSNEKFEELLELQGECCTKSFKKFWKI